MNDYVKFLRHGAVAQLQNGIENNLPFYESMSADFAEHIVEDSVRTASSMHASPELVAKIKMPTTEENHDAFNSVLVHQSLRLNPAQACDDRIWTYLSHFDLRHYALRRWPLPKSGKAAHVRSHYFVKNQRGLLRDNAIARLWWMGHIASRSEHLGMKPIEVLNVLLHHSDVRANLLERSLGMNPDIFDAVVSRLAKDYAKVKKDKKEVPHTLFYRDRFRGLMKSLNRIGGYRMLDALGFEQLQNEIKIILAEG